MRKLAGPSLNICWTPVKAQDSEKVVLMRAKDLEELEESHRLLAAFVRRCREQTQGHRWRYKLAGQFMPNPIDEDAEALLAKVPKEEL